MKLLINEMFGPTLQGEGSLIGRQCLFIRTNTCNLRCEWLNKDGTTTKCDTPYTSWKPEQKKPMEISEIVTMVEVMVDEYNVKYIVISGGEPFLQPGIVELVDELKKLNLHITIETNGTIFRETKADLISMSPKLMSSVPKMISPEQDIHIKNRVYNRHNIEKFKQYYNNIQFKFVYNSKEDLIEIINMFQIPFEIDSDDIWLMPQGITKEQLAQKSIELFDLCSEQGYNYSPRLHIDVYNDKRGI